MNNMNKSSLLPLVFIGSLISGCSFIPEYTQPDISVSDTYPVGPAYNEIETESITNVNIENWSDFFNDPRLVSLIQTALENNRDLRVASLNIEVYQNQYRIQRANLFPAINIKADANRQHLPGDLTGDEASSASDSTISSQYGVNIGTTAWEVDLFGRVRALKDQALEQYLATEAAQKSVQISLIANVANAYLTLKADEAQLELTKTTLKAYEESYELTKRSFDIGASSQLDVTQLKTEVERARVMMHEYTRLVAQDKNALLTLLGTEIPEDLPSGLSIFEQQLMDVPVGLPSDLLQNRPDIIQAEYQLKAANANIGAARAAFFPSLNLTTNVGTLSPQAKYLFDAGSGSWLWNPVITLPIFNAGSLRASLDVAELQKDINIALYEQTIQKAFSEVANGLAAQGTYSDQIEAQKTLVDASQLYYDLASKRYNIGIDNYLTLLDAQRSLFASQQGLINDKLSQLVSSVNLYKSLGGGWDRESLSSK